MTRRTPKDTCQEFENPVDGILLTFVPFAGGQGLLPEVLIGGLEVIEISRDGLLVALDGSNTIDDRVDVKELSAALTWKGHIAVGNVDILLATTFTILPRASDETEKIGLSSVKIRVLKVPKLSFGIALQDALLEVGYLMKSVHVQLSNKGGKIPVLEKSWKDIIRKAFVLKDWGRMLDGAGGD
jgi:hypothetical protein